MERGVNFYSYVGGKPLVGLDFFGLEECEFRHKYGKPFEVTWDTERLHELIMRVPEMDNAKLTTCLMTPNHEMKVGLPSIFEMIACAISSVNRGSSGIYRISWDTMGAWKRIVVTERWCRENECDSWVKVGEPLYTDENLSGDFLGDSHVRYRYMKVDDGGSDLDRFNGLGF